MKERTKERILGFLNRNFLRPIGLGLLESKTIYEMIALCAAYRATLAQHLEPGQAIVWDPKERSINLVTRH